MRLKMHRVPCSLLKSGVGCINPAAQYKKVHSGKIWGVSGCTCMRSLARSKASPCCWSEATNFGAKIPAPPAWVPHLAETTAKHRGTGENRHPATPLSKVCKRSKTARTLEKIFNTGSKRKFSTRKPPLETLRLSEPSTLSSPAYLGREIACDRSWFLRIESASIFSSADYQASGVGT